MRNHTGVRPTAASGPSLERPLAHSVIVFDLDGTPSDPLEGIGRSINYALARFGYPERPLETLAGCIGPPLDETFPLLTGKQ